MTFRKDDAGKPRIHLLPTEALLGAARVMTHGAEKYSDHNWRKAASWNRYYDAAQRHLMLWQLGEDTDESGLPAIDHAACSVLMLSSLIKTETGIDDRFFGFDEDEAEPEPVVTRPRRRKRS